MIRKKIEVGINEKHTVEFSSNAFTGIEEVLIDGVSVHRKFSMNGIDRTFEVGNAEKHAVRIKAGWKEQIMFSPLFYVDGALVTSAPGKLSPVKSALAITGMALSFACGWYAGIFAAIVFISWVALAAAAIKIWKGKASELALTLASLQVGYMLWLLVAAVMMARLDIMFDVLVLSAAAVLTVARPGFGTAVFLIAYHAVGAVVNLVQIFQTAPGGQEHKALFTHLMVRAFSIVLAAALAMEVKKEKTA